MGKQVIQSRCVSLGALNVNGSISSLLFRMPIRLKRLAVEPDKGGTHRLRPDHTFDGWMQTSNRLPSPRDQRNHLRLAFIILRTLVANPFYRRLVACFFPCHSIFQAERQISSFEDFLAKPWDRVIENLARIP